MTRHGWLIACRDASDVVHPHSEEHRLTYSAGVMMLSREYPQRSRHAHRPLLLGMSEDAMTSGLLNLKPTVSGQFADHLSRLHHDATVEGPSVLAQVPVHVHPRLLGRRNAARSSCDTEHAAD